MLIVKNIHISYYAVSIKYLTIQNSPEFPNPDPGLTDEEKETLYKRLKDGGWI